MVLAICLTRRDLSLPQSTLTLWLWSNINTFHHHSSTHPGSQPEQHELLPTSIHRNGSTTTFPQQQKSKRKKEKEGSSNKLHLVFLSTSWPPDKTHGSQHQQGSEGVIGRQICWLLPSLSSLAASANTLLYQYIAVYVIQEHEG